MGHFCTFPCGKGTASTEENGNRTLAIKTRGGAGAMVQYWLPLQMVLAPNGRAHNPITAVAGGLISLSDLFWHCKHVVHKHSFYFSNNIFREIQGLGSWFRNKELATQA